MTEPCVYLFIYGMCRKYPVILSVRKLCSTFKHSSNTTVSTLKTYRMSLKIVLSPAKSLDWETKLPSLSFTEPEFLEEASVLMDELKLYSAEDLKKLMKISGNLAALNHERNQNWEAKLSDDARPAVYAYSGDVYAGLDAWTMNGNDIVFAQNHVRIISGLYGILKPLDKIYPYRLEMGTPLSVDGKSNLYKFWNTALARALNAEMEEEDVLINLASQEYFKALPASELKASVIEPAFYDYKNGKYKIISFFAKKARGMMTRYIINHRIEEAEQIKGFDVGGYSYSEPMSSGNKWAFIRG